MASLRATFALTLAVCSLFFSTAGAFGAKSLRGLVEDSHGTNRALVVGVSHGLPGIDLDAHNVEKMVTNPAYAFKYTELMDEAGTVQGIVDHLTKGSAEAGKNGTFLFYFSGHGGPGELLAEDDTIQIEQIRDAVKAGRSAGPLARLVMVFDSCYAGSLMDPLRHPFRLGEIVSPQEITAMNHAFSEQVVRTMTEGIRGSSTSYWKKLFVFASSRADETSGASDDGSTFTVAMDRAFKASVKSNSTIRQFIDQTIEYTTGQTPVARLVPPSLGEEKMIK